MDGLICEFFVQFQNDGYDFGQDFIVFEDFLKYLVVYFIKCFMEVNDIRKYNCKKYFCMFVLMYVYFWILKYCIFILGY